MPPCARCCACAFAKAAKTSSSGRGSRQHTRSAECPATSGRNSSATATTRGHSSSPAIGPTARLSTPLVAVRPGDPDRGAARSARGGGAAHLPGVARHRRWQGPSRARRHQYDREAGEEADFERAYLKVAERLRGTPGHVREELLKEPDSLTYHIFAEWDTAEDFATGWTTRRTRTRRGHSFAGLRCRSSVGCTRSQRGHRIRATASSCPPIASSVPAPQRRAQPAPRPAPQPAPRPVPQPRRSPCRVRPLRKQSPPPLRCTRRHRHRFCCRRG